MADGPHNCTELRNVFVSAEVRLKDDVQRNIQHKSKCAKHNDVHIVYFLLDCGQRAMRDGATLRR